MKRINVLMLFVLIVSGNINCTPLCEENNPTLPPDELEFEVEIEGEHFIIENNTISMQFQKINKSRLKLINFSAL